MAIDPEKERFLRELGEDYGYPNSPKNIDELRATEFKRLDDVAYLDHAGATLYSESQMDAIFKDFNSTLYGNPHSQSDCSLTTSDIVDEARRQVLNFFNASPREYKCIFTSGATAALKLVGETFPWSGQSTFMYTMENHNSVLGIREYALNKGAAAFSADVEEVADHDQPNSGKSAIKIIAHQVQRRSEPEFLKKEATGDTYNLFAFPSECNFSGLRFNLDLVNVIKEDSYKMFGTSPFHRGNWMVLIDAAKGSTTMPPDLSKYKADFVVVSFYKLFGYPTGLGALIVRNEPSKLMKKTYFSGGTVAASIADIDFFKRREGVEEYFEDGTISYLSIASLHHGFKILSALTMPAISRHVSSLATYVRNKLLDLRHANGHRVCTIYGLRDSEVLCNKMGPTVSFNLKRPDGSWFGYREVEKLASLSGIQLRDAFVILVHVQNILVCLIRIFSLTLRQVHICWDDRDIMNGKPTGAVRVSFGYMSTFGDARKFLRFVENGFVLLPPESTYLDSFRTGAIYPVTEGVDRATARYFLKSITVYPIKSCAGFSVESWPLTRTGLLHDREWLLKSLNGEILTQKKVPDMCYITTMIDLNLGILFVESTRCKEKLQIKLTSDPWISGKEEVEIHSQRYEVQAYGDEIDNWFSKAVGRHCTLVRSSGSQSNLRPNGNKSPGTCRDFATSLNFVNEAQFLLISEESVADLNNRLRTKLQNGASGPPTEVTPMRFRPNLVMSGGEPYTEDGWRNLKIGDKYFTSLGGCNRCQMINMTSRSGEVQRSNEPLATLASYKRVKKN
ncbi:Molybdenum cofactor sulfurase [Forsythia ovata]|uniref:Molybdenum cofactor sulfurase n=1 Tax=Forsythia ovata TaxID=205694 RepID=A0ABD1S4Y7_9LAMI